MSTPSLSEKAKGKQRAVEPDQDEEATQRSAGLHAGPSASGTRSKSLRKFTVRFSEGVTDLEMSVTPQDTVREVLRRIRVARPTLARRKLRLIHAGRLLTPGTLLHGWLVSLETRQSSSARRLVISSPAADSKTAKDGIATGTVSWDSGDVYIHCSIGAEIPEGEVEDDSMLPPQAPTARGFDKLAAAGFSAEDIANMRSQFHTSRQRGLGGEEEDGALQQTPEDADEHLRALEEQWIDDFNAEQMNNPDMDDEGHWLTLLQGLFLGFFFPVFPFFFIAPSRPDAFFSDEYQSVQRPRPVVFTERMGMVIVLGFISNVAYGTLRWFSI
ncbi:hypothetical protein DL93DRAFT_2081687 [Clavulina sp. PMI_390]|nr:hypothetical protein DL93DRAFT_2081687 [Clavulina sp. PMI_390]